MKKLFIIVLISILMISLLSCAVKKNSSSDFDDDQTPPPDTTTVSNEPKPDPEPVIDMDELYRKVFENQSKCYTIEEAPELYDLDRSKNPLILYFYDFYPEVPQFVENVWIIEDVTSDFANGLLEKYLIDSRNSASYDYTFTYVHGYYHTAYLDVLFNNVTFEAVSGFPDDNIRFATIKGEEKHPDRCYYAYRDMKLYYKEDGVVYRSVQNVDTPYLHTMARQYMYQWAPDKPIGCWVYNVNLDNKGTPKIITVQNSQGEQEDYYIYPNGEVYSGIKGYSLGQTENPPIHFVYWSEARVYFSTETRFRECFEGKIIKE